MLSKVSLNRNTHETRLCTDWLTKNGFNINGSQGT